MYCDVLSCREGLIAVRLSQGTYVYRQNAPVKENKPQVLPPSEEGSVFEYEGIRRWERLPRREANAWVYKAMAFAKKGAVVSTPA